MVWKLKTSQKAMEIFKEIDKRFHLKPYVCVKHAIVWSLREFGPIDSFDTDSNGIELNRQTITGDYDIYFKVLIEQVEETQLSETEYFPQYIKAHIDRGAPQFLAMLNHAATLERYVLNGLGVGETV